jgi:hypothetical protein
MPGKRGDVAGPLPQRRQMDGGDVQAEEEILPELSGGDRRIEVDIGGGEDAHVDRNRVARAEADDLSLLQDAEQLDLERSRQVADLVEEEGAAVGRLEPADLVLEAPVKAPFSYPKSSASTRLSTRAPQLTATKGPALRLLFSWM